MISCISTSVEPRTCFPLSSTLTTVLHLQSAQQQEKNLRGSYGYAKRFTSFAKNLFVDRCYQRSKAPEEHPKPSCAYSLRVCSHQFLVSLDAGRVVEEHGCPLDKRRAVHHLQRLDGYLLIRLVYVLGYRHLCPEISFCHWH